MAFNLSGNPYGTASNISPHESEDDGHCIIAQATLALAFEQRTANLIAYIESFGGGIEYETIWADIRARLGLGDK
ncbi:hypothetical protein [Glutamicibacter sp. AOP3-A1-12]|uniref:hypothetical protein n=1 Tax=Glutamicibacter sp. AOP3-A1-12 TaxID=3457701 RepID=UPI0040342C79